VLLHHGIHHCSESDDEGYKKMGIIGSLFDMPFTENYRRDRDPGRRSSKSAKIVRRIEGKRSLRSLRGTEAYEAATTKSSSGY
jgi:hypothetical protein